MIREMKFNSDILDRFIPAHDIEHSGLAHRRGAHLREVDRRVSSHEEVAARRGDERGHQPDEVVVHVARVAKRGGGGRHHGRDQRIQLVHRGVLQTQPE